MWMKDAGNSGRVFSFIHLHTSVLLANFQFFHIFKENDVVLVGMAKRVGCPKDVWSCGEMNPAATNASRATLVYGSQKVRTSRWVVAFWIERSWRTSSFVDKISTILQQRPALIADAMFMDWNRVWTGETCRCWLCIIGSLIKKLSGFKKRNKNKTSACH